MPDDTTHKATRAGIALLVIILAFASWIHLPKLGHQYLPGWDEAIHAAVAANMSLHPFEPTLVDTPITPLDFHNWQDSHVWLHMPPMPFWQAALSIKIGGRSFFSLRFPAFLLFLGTIICIYFLGLKLYGQNAGLLGAIIYASAPFGWLEVQGYHFGDMTDVSLAFWLTLCAVSIERSLRTWKKGWMVLAGLSQAAAVLSKSALGLAPAGAVMVMWLAPKLRIRLSQKPKWHLPALVLGMGMGGWQAWRLYAAHRWPMQWAHEAKVQWLHVTSSYEGHGRPYDALFNDLLANLYTPALVLFMLAAATYVAYLAVKHRKSPVVLHALWIAGTWLPLLFVKTKVPAVLFGMTPALALAAAALMMRISRARPGAWAYALSATPLIFTFFPHLFGLGWFSFAEKIVPDMARSPFLPTQIAIAAGLWLIIFSIFSAMRLVKITGKAPAWAGRMASCFFIVAAMASVLAQQRTTRMSFDIIADYNPVATTVNKLKDLLPEGAAILIEGVSNGRQRPALTASFLTGHPARLVHGAYLANIWKKAKKMGPVCLLTPIKRQARAIITPTSENGWWVYLGGDGPPVPADENPSEFFAQYPTGPDLVSFSPEKTDLAPGQVLNILATWRAKGPASTHLAKLVFEPMDSGHSIDPWPIPEDFPEGIEAIHLHNLAPPGLLWGHRPFGQGLGEPARWHRNWSIAERFFIWVPLHLKPGKYRLVQKMIHLNREENPIRKVAWPVVSIHEP